MPERILLSASSAAAGLGDVLTVSVPVWVVLAVVAVWTLVSLTYTAAAKWLDWPPTRESKRGPASFDAAVLSGALANPAASFWVIRPEPGRPAGEARLLWSDGALLSRLGLATGQITNTAVGDYEPAAVLAHYERAFATGAAQSFRETFNGRQLDVHLAPQPDGTWVGSAYDQTELLESRDRLRRERDGAVSERDRLRLQGQVDAERRLAEERLSQLHD